MNKDRLQAFSDGVFAILITIMVLDLKVPEGSNWHALRPLIPVALSYVLSFVFLGIYWNNHHHMLHLTFRINGRILWANLHLLFWISLIPFTTSWMGKNGLAAVPTALYGMVLFFSGMAYYLLSGLIIADQGAGSALADALGNTRKEKASVGLYAIAIGLAFAHAWLDDAIYVVVALMWLVPDRRIEAKVMVQRD
jgi:uncharacterized membrane protein